MNMIAKSCSIIAALYAIAIAEAAAPPTLSVSVADLSRIQYEISMWWGYLYQHGDTAAAELQLKFNSDWERQDGVLLDFRAGEDDSAFNDRNQLAKALFLCTWMKTHVAQNPTPLDFCDTTQAISTQINAAVGRERKYAHDRAATRRRAFARRVKSDQDQTLCIAYNAYRYPEARAELARRQAISSYEWSLREKRHVSVGMSELALICSLGPAKVNETVTAAGASKQYQYSDDFLVYVEGGRVVAIQDSQ